MKQLKHLDFTFLYSYVLENTYYSNILTNIFVLRN